MFPYVENHLFYVDGSPSAADVQFSGGMASPSADLSGLSAFNGATGGTLAADGTIESANAAAAGIFGYAPAAMVGRSVGGLLAHADPGSTARPAATLAVSAPASLPSQTRLAGHQALTVEDVYATENPILGASQAVAAPLTMMLGNNIAAVTVEVLGR